MSNYNVEKLTTLIKSSLEDLGTTYKVASDNQFYKATASVFRNILEQKHKEFIAKANQKGQKQVYYLSMEFLMGRSLKTTIHNLELVKQATESLKEMGVNLENLYELEPDAGLGNGGLGRLAACFLDSLATLNYPATGYSICYEFGIFKQKLVDGWQTELPDNWLPGGDVWLKEAPQSAIEVKFGGDITEMWDGSCHYVTGQNFTTVNAIPVDMYVSGFSGEGVSLLRLWKAQSPAFDMDLFNSGDYIKALGKSTHAEAISKVLYPNDNHTQGKMLRLRQQYFLCAASIGDIINKHMATYGTLDNLSEKVAIHINDTHPTLAIPELMRILLDDCGYSWDNAWEIVTKTFAYTNHTVMSEALECWNECLFQNLLPRIHQIIFEINNRFVYDLTKFFDNDKPKIDHMSIVQDNCIKMANLCVHAGHSVNGVSKLHSEIIKDDLFHDFYLYTPEKFNNVTNGIAYRRWLSQSNPRLTSLITDAIGDKFIKDASELQKLIPFEKDLSFLKNLADVKHQNKIDFSNYISKTTGISLNTDSIFDVQVKRLHEYKRQHLNALNIVSEFKYLLENPDADFVPKTYIFGAKAAPGYFLAKQIIKLIYTLSTEIEKHPKIREKLRVLYLEDYRVTLSEMLMPASEVSEQISLAGTEASGTGNMKLMLNGALTIGTFDGANIEICESAGKENMFTFGLLTNEVNELKKSGYFPMNYYNKSQNIRDAINFLSKGIGGVSFEEITNSLRHHDPYMVLADFDDYQKTQALVSKTYTDTNKWNKMSLANIAGSRIFSADRSIEEYATKIWNLK
jgi:starch phosphorylase